MFIRHNGNAALNDPFLGNHPNMPRIGRVQSGTGIYHVMLRGINRQDIFVDGVEDGDNEYAYNPNGAMTMDLNKGITNISYDQLGNLREITLSGNRSIRYIYAADGTRLRTTHTRRVGNSYLRDSTEYLGNLIVKNGVPSMYRFPGGYISFHNNNSLYHYYTRDHLGNNRAVVNEYGGIEQVTHYYPFGAVYADAGYADAIQRFKYNGKELDRMHGLNQYDYGAPNYDPLLCRFTQIDPLAEKYYWISPYAYCANNPVNAVDPDGKWVWVVAGAAIDYGFQVFNNLQEGNNLVDASFNNVNFAEVALSAINPTGKFSTLKTLAIETVKATVSASPHKGIKLESRFSNIVSNTVVNATTNKVAGKIVKQSSAANLKKVNNDLKTAIGNANKAKQKMQQRPNVKGWEKAFEKSQICIKSGREKQVATQMLNNTIGQFDEDVANSFISNTLQEFRKKEDKDEDEIK